MSYCRFSSLNWMCDVYCYEDTAGGWTTHVAAGRRGHEPTPEPEIGTVLPEEWVTAHQKTMAELAEIPMENIGLPHDGETFNDSTLETFRDRLIMLRAAGYIVPDYVFDLITDELAEHTP